LGGGSGTNPSSQIDISDDGFLNLMTADGDTKDDVRMPEGEVGQKINKLFVEEEKDTRKFDAAGIAKHVQPLTRHL
jgi:hypothetical protein